MVSSSLLLVNGNQIDIDPLDSNQFRRLPGRRDIRVHEMEYGVLDVLKTV
jgi:hypothetical protein